MLRTRRVYSPGLREYTTFFQVEINKMAWKRGPAELRSTQLSAPVFLRAACVCVTLRLSTVSTLSLSHFRLLGGRAWKIFSRFRSYRNYFAEISDLTFPYLRSLLLTVILIHIWCYLLIIYISKLFVQSSWKLTITYSGNGMNMPVTFRAIESSIMQCCEGEAYHTVASIVRRIWIVYRLCGPKLPIERENRKTMQISSSSILILICEP